MSLVEKERKSSNQKKKKEEEEISCKRSNEKLVNLLSTNIYKILIIIKIYISLIILGNLSLGREDRFICFVFFFLMSVFIFKLMEI